MSSVNCGFDYDVFKPNSHFLAHCRACRAPNFIKHLENEAKLQVNCVFNCIDSVKLTALCDGLRYRISYKSIRKWGKGGMRVQAKCDCQDTAVYLVFREM